jgi:hypothetical protein
MICTWHCCQNVAEQDMLCPQHYQLMHPPPPPTPPPEPVVADEFAHRTFGSVNVYIRELERENATLRRRVRVLEELVSKS